MNVGCNQMAQLLFDFVEGELASETEAAVLRHLDHCDGCDEFIAKYKKATKLARDVMLTQMPEELADRLASYLRSQTGA